MNQLSATQRRRLTVGAVRFMSAGGFPPEAPERRLLAAYANGKLSIDEVLQRLQTEPDPARSAEPNCAFAH